MKQQYAKVRLVVTLKDWDDWEWWVEKEVLWPFPWLPRPGESIEVEPGVSAGDFIVADLITHYPHAGITELPLETGIMSCLTELVDKFHWKVRGKRKLYNKARRDHNI